MEFHNIVNYDQKIFKKECQNITFSFHEEAVVKFDAENFRENFPILQKLLPGRQKLVYFDNCATTQKPQVVIDKIAEFYSRFNANVHRGLYDFSEHATESYEQTRSKVANYLGIKNRDEVIFTHGTTEAINLVAESYCKHFLTKGDEILVGTAEHHANYLPWQALEQEIGIVRKSIPLNADSSIDFDAYESLFSEKTKFVAVQHISNVLGVKNDVTQIAKIAHAHGAKILIDGASTLAFERPNISNIDCDFFACSAHKGFGPMGVGLLAGKYELLDQMPPYQVGGGIVNKVNFDQTTYQLPPHKFEPGTPDVAAVIGFGATIDFLENIDWDSAKEYLAYLNGYCFAKLQKIPTIQLYARPDLPIISFNLTNVHSHDVATYLASKGIAVRAGTHCAQPLMRTLGCPGTVRISLALYNTTAEIDFVIATIAECAKRFS